MEPTITTTSELPHIIPPLPEGDTKDLKVWREYWTQHDSHIRKDEREKVLDRLDKEIHIREDEMNRKAGLEENLVTISGYYASAGALNWVRKVLIDGSRETI